MRCRNVIISVILFSFLSVVDSSVSQGSDTSIGPEIPKKSESKDIVDLSGWYSNVDPETGTLSGMVNVLKTKHGTYFVVWIYNVVVEDDGKVTQRSSAGTGLIKKDVFVIQTVPEKRLYLYEVHKDGKNISVTGDGELWIPIAPPKLSKSAFESLLSVCLVSTFFDDGKTSSIEVIFNDDSKLNMTSDMASVDLETKYGKLTIPLDDIQSIEFGLHYPEGSKSRIVKAINALESSTYKDRETAERELLYFGNWSYALVRDKHNTANEEGKRRIAKIMGMLERIYSDSMLHRDCDTIRTVNGCVISGQLILDSWKMKSKFVGDVSVAVSGIKRIHVLSNLLTRQFSLDSAKYGDEWMETKVQVDTNIKLTVTCFGKIDLWPQTAGTYVADPNGYSSNGRGNKYPAGIVLGKIGKDGEEFIIGSRYVGVPKTFGNLFVRIVPNAWNTTSMGSYKVEVKTSFR